MSKLTAEANENPADYLTTHTLPVGISLVLGTATLKMQYAMPAEMRNSARYKSWLPTAAGTGQDREQERLAVLLEWMWGTVLPQLQPLADAKGFGYEWRKMCEEKTEDAADTAFFATLGHHHSDDAQLAAKHTASAAARAASWAAGNRFWQAVDPILVLESMTILDEINERSDEPNK